MTPPHPRSRSQGRRPSRSSLLAAAFLLLAVAPVRAQVADEPEPATPARWGLGLRLVCWGTTRSFGASRLASLEALTGSTRELRSELRADAVLELGQLRLGAKPRLEFGWHEWAQRPSADREETRAEAFLNAAEIAWDAGGRLQLSLERSAPDWGPSVIFSASNPLSRRNARLNPKEELPGSDFATARWFPGDAWTVSLLANVAAGRARVEGFQRSAVLKIDAAGGGIFASLVLSRVEDGAARSGAFVSGSPAEGLLLYAEAGALRRDAEAVGGLTYTLSSGPMLTAEYFFNESGRAHGDAERAAAPLADDPREVFLRRRYLLLQISDIDAALSGEALLRVLHCLDDGSTALVGYLEKGVGGRVRVFLFGIRTFGAGGDEFPAVLRSAITGGFEFAF